MSCFGLPSSYSTKRVLNTVNFSFGVPTSRMLRIQQAQPQPPGINLAPMLVDQPLAALLRKS